MIKQSSIDLLVFRIDTSMMLLDTPDTKGFHSGTVGMVMIYAPL